MFRPKRVVLMMSVLGAFVLAVADTPAAQRGLQSRGQDRTAEARRHYQVALVALKNGDIEIAGQELEEAARLAPDNAQVWYSFAVVESKRGNPDEGLAHLQKALDLGLPDAMKDEADQLLAELTYEAKKKANDTENREEKTRARLGRYANDLEQWIGSSRNAKVRSSSEERLVLDSSKMIGNYSWDRRFVNVEYRLRFEDIAPTTLSCDGAFSPGECVVELKCRRSGCMQLNDRPYSDSQIMISWGDEYEESARRANIALNALIRAANQR